MNETVTAPRAWWTMPRPWRWLPLYGAMNAAGVIARLSPGRWPVRDQNANDDPGVTIIVPERGTPDLLVETLTALEAATATLTEPTQVIVVVNGAPASDYRELRARFPAAAWYFFHHSLGYNGAIDAGLAHARHAWCYLLNSDMRLEADALAQLLPYRQAQVFAITSQIFFTDPQRRREETGWSDFHWNSDCPEVYERTPEPGELARGNFYPGGGSSLFRTALLRRYVRDSRDYSPFYWEDADWGLRAWSEGYEVLFCPTSRAWHHHRGTIGRHYDPKEVERIVQRNALLFDLRHGWSGRRPDNLLAHVTTRDPRTQAELRGLPLAWRAFRSRLATRRAQRRGLAFDKLATDSYYAPSRRDGRRPRVLLVSPFALFPPAHGGARRIAELVARLNDDVEFILLGDERSLYTPASEPWLRNFRAAHLIEGRGDRPGDPPLTLAQRLDRHDWPHLQRELHRLIALYDPDIVQVEFMELARLAAQRIGRERWLLALHDVYLGDRASDAATDALQASLIDRFDAVTACSGEDAALVRHRHVALIGNGAVDRRIGYVPSSDEPPRLLFMGPFRYRQNLDGILEFIDTAWPVLKRAEPDLVLTILGGAESDAIARGEARFRQPDIDVVSTFVDPTAHLSDCTLTINPQRDIRGSSIKLIESLLAGRVCVSTADGARGFTSGCLDGLVVATDIAAMAAPIVRLLADRRDRHRLERGSDSHLDGYTWDAMAKRQLALYRQLLAVRT